jgi:2-polyprenyl-3-methyl-5-hydroxy-6-metoxy-1,4-benzoquinol methylase
MMAENDGHLQQHWLDLLERKFQNYFFDPGDDNIKRWLATAQGGIVAKGHNHRNAVEQLLHGPLAQVRVLDAGCGTGDITFAFAEAGAVVMGIDKDPEFVTICRLRQIELGLTKTHFVLADLCHGVPVATEQFDVALSIDVIEHVEDPPAYLASIYQLLRPGGYLYLLTVNKYAFVNIQRDPHYKLAGVVLLPRPIAQWYVSRIRRKVRLLDVYKMFSIRELSFLLRRSGFSDIAFLGARDAQEALKGRTALASWTKRLALKGLWEVVYQWLWAHTIKVWARRPVSAHMAECHVEAYSEASSAL